MVTDFDRTISAKAALFRKKEESKDLVTRRLPVGNDATELTAQVCDLRADDPKPAKERRRRTPPRIIV